MNESDISGEYDCVECGRHIIQVAGPVNQFHLCATCMTLPGWHLDPVLRKQLDPGIDDE